MNIAFAYNVKHNDPSRDLQKQKDLDFDAPETIDRIAQTIESLGHNVIRIEADETAFEKLKANKDRIDLVFNIAEGLYGDAREAWIPVFCEVLKIPYTHSSPTTHTIKLNKQFTKLIMAGLGIRVPASLIITKKEEADIDGMSYPVIIKPNAEGSSVGIFDKNVVRSQEDLKARVSEMYDGGFKGDLLIEEFIEGREFTVGVLGNFPPKILPIIEQKFEFLPKGMNHMASFELKWVYEDTLKNLTDAYDCPANLTPELQQEIEKNTLVAYNTLNTKDCARVDYRLSKDNKLYFLEINTLPGINPAENVISYYPLAARTSGLSFKDLVSAIIANACQRYSITPGTVSD